MSLSSDEHLVRLVSLVSNLCCLVGVPPGLPRRAPAPTDTENRFLLKLCTALRAHIPWVRLVRLWLRGSSCSNLDARAGGTGPCLRTSLSCERKLRVAWRTPGTTKGVIRSAFMTGGQSQRKGVSLLLILFPLHTSEVNGICNYRMSTNGLW